MSRKELNPYTKMVCSSHNAGMLKKEQDNLTPPRNKKKKTEKKKKTGKESIGCFGEPVPSC